jgi:hypothetical protein
MGQFELLRLQQGFDVQQRDFVVVGLSDGAA